MSLEEFGSQAQAMLTEVYYAATNPDPIPEFDLKVLAALFEELKKKAREHECFITLHHAFGYKLKILPAPEAITLKSPRIVDGDFREYRVERLLTNELLSTTTVKAKDDDNPVARVLATKREASMRQPLYTAWMILHDPDRVEIEIKRYPSI